MNLIVRTWKRSVGSDNQVSGRGYQELMVAVRVNNSLAADADAIGHG
jgi:hypothetical protein